MALNFFLANDQNVFIFNDHTQNNASATGKVIVFGNATYNNYNVGADLPLSTKRTDFALQVAGNMNITAGTNFTQNSSYDPATGSVTTYTMINLNGVPAQPLKQAMSTKEYATDFLHCSSIGWASVKTESMQAVVGTTLTLTGTSPTLNSFLISSTNVAGSGQNISTITSINLVVPAGSTIIVSIDGVSVTLNNFTTLLNGSPITNAQAQYILWNFPESTNILINSNIYGSFLAPFASVNSTAVTIYGTLMAVNLTGSIKAVNNLFTGILPDLYNPSSSETCSSFTTTATTTTTTTTTTSSTTTMSTTTCAPRPWDQAINDLIESIALEQTGLSHILNAEGEKIQKAVTMNLTADQLLVINKSVKDMVNTISKLEMILQSKLEAVNCTNLCDK